MTGDLRARILDRLDQLETLAREAGGLPWHWETVEDDAVSTPNLASEYLADAADVALLGPAGSTGHESDWAKDLPLSAIERASEVRSGAAAHIIAWDPPTVLTLCAYARRILTRHEPLDDSTFDDDGEDYLVSTCQGNHRLGPDSRWPCADVEDLAGMLGVDPDQPAEGASSDR